MIEVQHVFNILSSSAFKNEYSPVMDFDGVEFSTPDSTSTENETLTEVQHVFDVHKAPAFENRYIFERDFDGVEFASPDSTDTDSTSTYTNSTSTDTEDFLSTASDNETLTKVFEPIEEDQSPVPKVNRCHNICESVEPEKFSSWGRGLERGQKTTYARKQATVLNFEPPIKRKSRKNRFVALVVFVLAVFTIIFLAMGNYVSPSFPAANRSYVSTNSRNRLKPSIHRPNKPHHIIRSPPRSPPPPPPPPPQPQYHHLLVSLTWPMTYCIHNPCISRPPDFVLHGLWPSDQHGQSIFVGFKGCKRTTLPAGELNTYIHDLYTYWYSLKNGKNNTFLRRQWNKHGTCVQGMNWKSYFRLGRSTRSALGNIISRFRNVGVVASNSTGYVTRQILAAIQEGVGTDKDVQVTCLGDLLNRTHTDLYAMAFCMMNDGTVIDCPGRANKGCAGKLIVIKV